MKKKNLHLICGLIISFLMVWMCQNPIQAQSYHLRDVLDKVKIKEHIVFDGSNVKTRMNYLDVKSDELLVLKMRATPSTGYQWELTDASKEVVELVEIPLHEACDHAYAPGSEVWQYIVLKPKKRGKSELEFSYQRPWQKEKTRENSLKVRVHAKGAYKGNFNYVPINAERVQLQIADYELRSAPSYWNWAEKGVVTPVRDQGSCGSCWAFGSVAGFEAKILKKDGEAKDVSEQYAVSCNDFGFSCAGGWWVHDVWQQYVPAGEAGAGAVYETDFPYQAVDADCNPPHEHFEQLEGWAYVDDVPDKPWPTQLHDPSVAQVKQKLLEWGPIPTALCTDNWGSYKGGIMSGSTSKYTTHIVLITGYDDHNQCWIIKNSWGDDWGENGYCRIRYGSHLVGQYSTYLKYDKTNPRLVLQGNKLWEALENNGGIRGSLEAKLLDAGSGFALTSGQMTSNVHYKIFGLPAGLSTQIEVLNQQKIKIKILGNATSHVEEDDTNISIEFLDAAFADFSATEIENHTSTIALDFFNPYQVIYEDVEDITCSTGENWQFFRLDDQIPMGLWYSYYYDPYPSKRMTFFLETYTKKALCTTAGTGTNDRMIKLLQYGDVIDGESEYFVTGGSYGDQHRIYNNTYTDWYGKTAYAGITVQRYGATCYGWLKLRVTSSSVTLLEYAFNEEPYAAIKAGHTTSSSVNPIAQFSVEPTTIFEGETVKFTDKSLRNPDTWNWSFEGGTPEVSGEQHPVVTYHQKGTYNVSLRVSNAAGVDDVTKNNIITVYSAEAPKVDFTFGNTIPQGGSIQFTDASSNFPTSWNWTFEGGNPSSSTAQNPIVTYPNPGTYDVTLSATNQFGTGTLTIENAVTVEDVPINYCSASHSLYLSSLYFDRIQLGELDHQSEFNSNGYEDHTAYHANLTAGSQYTINFGVHNDHWQLNSVGAWIDWNRDGDFDDAAEQVFSMQGQKLYTATFVAPAFLSEGVSRMRVRVHYDKTPFACGVDSYMGETEDYTVVLSGGSGVQPLEYCTATHALYHSSLYFKNVKLADLDHTSEYSGNGYQDHTVYSASLQAGQQYSIYFDVMNDHWPYNSVGAWIDWNNDGDFTDSGEQIFNMYGQKVYSGSFIVPSDIADGSTRMRVRVHYDKWAFPCDEDPYMGETEDYTIVLKARGTHEFVATKNIRDDLMDKNVILTPNPTDDKFKITTSNLGLPIDILIYDISGRLVKEINDYGGHEISTLELSKGTYLINIKTKEKVIVKKLIVK
jgi:PKD repeat protein/C1A family cysteine protease